jgi:predicted RND superfamily exporter protein
VVISIFFAFLILLYATGNVVQSVVSIFCVTIVIVSIMAIMHINGKKLGTAESISLVVLIGFSVDYIVHLSADYMHSAYFRRYDKMRQAYREMGVSILSGCITTFGCGFCLFFGNFTFFQTFGLVVTMTIFTSFIVAIFTFGALMHLWGPEQSFGMLFKTTREPTKEEREEIEMRLIQIDEVSAEMNQKIGSKLSKIDCHTNSKLEELTKEMEEMRE